MKKLFLYCGLVLFFAVLPFFIDSRFWLGFWTMALFFALLGQSWNVLGGYGGQRRSATRCSSARVPMSRR